ncbi:MAG: IgGFc-binding protein [Alphaproteobacteria bacterium]|nr:IgGFc-binding protein [Alphaproteobacteria bacterium]
MRVILVLALSACRSDYEVVGAEPPAPPLPPSLDASTRGTAFAVGFMENLDLAFNGSPTFSLRVVADAPTEVTVRFPRTGLVEVHEVGAGLTALPLPDAILYPQGSDVRGRQGFLVEASAPIDLLAVHDRLYFSEASLILPLTELGTRTRVLAVPSEGTGRSEFLVVATRDDTTLRITPSQTTLAAFPAGQPVDLTLDAGETWQVQSLEDLSGSLVEASAPVAVFGGGVDAEVSCWATSHAWDQLLPTTRWGLETHVVPMLGQGGDLVRVASDTDGTEVRLDCGEPVVLDAGEVAAFPLDAPTRITSSHPVAVGQLARGGSCTASGLGDANLVVTTPTALYRDGGVAWGPWGERGFSVDPDGRVDVQGWSATFGTTDPEPASELTTDATVALDGPLRGIAYAFTSFDALTFNLGWDCEGCVADLAAPPACDSP